MSPRNSPPLALATEVEVSALKWCLEGFSPGAFSPEVGLGHSCPWSECCSNRPGRFFVYFVCLFFWKKSNCRQALVKEQPERPPVLTWPVLLTCPSPAFPSSLFPPGSCLQVHRAALRASWSGLARVILTLEAGKLLETLAFSGEKKDMWPLLDLHLFLASQGH